ncbi:MAG: indolepyruvate ferredoxin oxidoreductase subunit alpha [Thermaerobacter sp.]|nr:indolepyruvate ferredoxin oxidoreductase subunit alpha [Thermaerobacter sp.]
MATATKTRALLLGNEAIALGALHAGIRVATGYPGTPSTETLEYLAKIAPPSVAVEWAINEKVALDEGVGAALVGARTLVTMKHVGLNVAMDAWMTSPLVGVNAGLVLLVADDPGMHSSQNEQDSRYLGRFAGVPIFEPTDSQECYSFVRAAFLASERWDSPVMVRTTTRISHSRSPVHTEEPDAPERRSFRRNPGKYVMLPANARSGRLRFLERLPQMAEWAENHPFNQEELRSTAVGVIAGGAAYQYVRDVMPEASVLKLGIAHPMPEAKIRAFAGKVDRLLVVEESEPYLEDQIRNLGIPVQGKAWFPRAGELSPQLVRQGLVRAGVLAPDGLEPSPEEWPETVARPPVLCAGCPHATPFLVLREIGAYVNGDIGCYTLGAAPPLLAMDTCLSMGSSVGLAVGMAKAGVRDQPIVAAIGDSTFLHGGIPGLIDAVWNDLDITVLILDNGTTAMTGGQPHPGTGHNLRAGDLPRLDIAQLCRTIGVRSVVVVDPYDVGATHRALLAATRYRGVSVAITNRPCVQAPVKLFGRSYAVNAERCDGCQLCMNLGCPALGWNLTHPDRRIARIDRDQCTGCTVCAQICPQSAIVPTAAD